MSVVNSAVIGLGFALAVALSACTTTKPILNVNDSPISTGKSLQASQVRQAIITAAGVLGWKIVDLKADLLQGTFRDRDHSAVVEIPYTTTNYSILFKGGVNLKEKDGEIHKAYNTWVQNLDKGIKTELARQ